VGSVESLPIPPENVLVTLTDVLHGEELELTKELKTAQRVGAVKRAAERLDDHGFGVEIRDVEHPYPPTKGIVDLADRVDAHAIVPSGRKRGAVRNPCSVASSSPSSRTLPDRWSSSTPRPTPSPHRRG
jgi:hypothetical protein